MLAIVLATAINAVVGDASWVEAHGAPPDASAGEVERIHTHLSYVLDRLRDADVSELSELQRARRAASLDDLEGYIERGLFPQRTDDAYEGRRPRFIDHRGVHCAVGYLIKASGHAELARAIDAAYEYAYVPEIDSPALLRWAADRGFTARELAMIQPAYRPPPTETWTRRLIADARDRLTLQCARKHEPLSKLRLRVRGDDRGRATVTARSKAGFARCFAELASKLERGGGAYDQEVRGYAFIMTVDITPPQKLLDRAFARLDLSGSRTRCLPRPGPIAERAQVGVTTGHEALAVAVRTSPRNREIESCIQSYLQKALAAFGPGRWRLEASATRELDPVITETSLRRYTRDYVRMHATGCYGGDESPGRVNVRVTARRDAGAFVIEIDGGDDAFRACLEKKIRKGLRGSYSVPRQLDDGTHERYFRIDADARASHTLTVESKQAREKRLEKHRRELEGRRRYGL